MRKKILCIVLIILICNFCLVSYANNNSVTNTINNTVTNTTGNTITDLQEEHKELRNQIESANTELENVQSELSDNLQKVQEIDAKIEIAQTQLDEINIKLATLKKKIAENEKELKKAKVKYESEKKLFEERIVAMYEAGDTEYIDVLLQSNGLSDFLSSYYLLEELAIYDTDIIDGLEKKKKKVEEIQNNLDMQKREMSDLKKDQTEISTEMENEKSIKENYILNLSEQEKEIQSKIDEYTQKFAKVNAEILTLSTEFDLDTEYIGGELAWPVPGYTRITSNYGMRTHPITGVYKLHTGVDIGAPIGANFIAANDGVVVKAEYNSAYGNMVVISHGGGIYTLYAHGSEIVVELGQVVKRGDVVLKVGSTGYSTGAHAHFEVRKDGVTVNPLPYITNGVIPNTEEDVAENSDTNQTQN